MPMILDEDQLLLQKTAQDYLATNAPVKHLRELRDAKSETGFSRKLWKEIISQYQIQDSAGKKILLSA